MTCDQDQRDIVQGCVDVRMLLHSAIGVGAVVMEMEIDASVWLAMEAVLPP